MGVSQFMDGSFHGNPSIGDLGVPNHFWKSPDGDTVEFVRCSL